MRSDDGWDSGHGELSPEVEQFLRPRETPRLRSAVLSATMAGAVASLAGALVLAYWRSNGLGESMLAARVIALKATGDPTVVDSALGFVGIILIGMACGIAGGALFGVVIARLIGKVGLVTAVGVGVIYGLLLWIVSQYVLLATFVPNAVALTNEYVLMIAHICYGACLGLLGGWSREARTQPQAVAFRLRHLWG